MFDWVRRLFASSEADSEGQPIFDDVRDDPYGGHNPEAVEEEHQLHSELDQYRRSLHVREVKRLRRFKKTMRGGGWVWTTARGEEIPVTDLKDDHLDNIISMLFRWGVTPVVPTPEVMHDILDESHIPYDSDGIDDPEAIAAICRDQSRERSSVMLYVCMKERTARVMGRFGDGDCAQAGW